MTPPQPPADRRATAPEPTAAAGAASETAAPTPSLTIDALGRKCPIPIIMLAERIREVPVGHVVAVLADDPAAKTDVPAWCGLKSQEFIVSTSLPGNGWTFLIRRSY